MDRQQACNRRLRVLVVDDHDMFRTGLRALLEEEGFEVADSATAEAALRRLPSYAPDVIVLDMNMPGMSGVEATPLILKVAPNASVLMLTIDADDDRVLDAVQAGASGYLLKDAELAEITAGIREVAGGYAVLTPRVAGAVLRSVRAENARRDEPQAHPGPKLSSREGQVLALLTRGCDNGDIARQLFVSPSTVKHHVSSLLEKLGAGNRVQAATFAVRTGLYDGCQPSA